MSTNVLRLRYCQTVWMVMFSDLAHYLMPLVKTQLSALQNCRANTNALIHIAPDAHSLIVRSYSKHIERHIFSTQLEQPTHQLIPSKDRKNESLICPHAGVKHIHLIAGICCVQICALIASLRCSGFSSGDLSRVSVTSRQRILDSNSIQDAHMP